MAEVRPPSDVPPWPPGSWQHDLTLLAFQEQPDLFVKEPWAKAFKPTGVERSAALERLTAHGAPFSQPFTRKTLRLYGRKLVGALDATAKQLPAAEVAALDGGIPDDDSAAGAERLVKLDWRASLRKLTIELLPYVLSSEARTPRKLVRKPIIDHTPEGLGKHCRNLLDQWLRVIVLAPDYAWREPHLEPTETSNDDDGPPDEFAGFRIFSLPAGRPKIGAADGLKAPEANDSATLAAIMETYEIAVPFLASLAFTSGKIGLSELELATLNYARTEAWTKKKRIAPATARKRRERLSQRLRGMAPVLLQEVDADLLIELVAFLSFMGQFRHSVAGGLAEKLLAKLKLMTPTEREECRRSYHEHLAGWRAGTKPHGRHLALFDALKPGGVLQRDLGSPEERRRLRELLALAVRRSIL